jgi:hypothetical protein
MPDQRPIWPWIVTALVGLPVLYVVSFGPACWICERLEKGTRAVSVAYRPVIWAGNRLPLGPGVMSRYAQLGARPQSTPDFRDDELAWWEYIAGPSSLTPYRSATHCEFGDLDDDPSGEGDSSGRNPEYRDDAELGDDAGDIIGGTAAVMPPRP